MPGFPVLHYLQLMFIESKMLSNSLIFLGPLLLLPSIILSIRVISNELTLCIRWPKYWIFSFNRRFPTNIQGWFSLGLTGFTSLQTKGLSRIFSSTTIQRINSSVLRLPYRSNLTSLHDYWKKNHSFDYTKICRQSNVSAF